MPGWPAAVLFDFDGVIVNSEPAHLRAFQLAAATEGIELTLDEYYGELIGYDDRGAWRRVFELHDRRPDETAIQGVMREKFAQMRGILARQEIQPLPGARELIESLHGRCAMAICSAAVREEVMTMLRGVRLDAFFPVVTCAEDVSVGKPDPGGYLLTMSRLSEMIGRSLTPPDCLVIEDAPAVVRSVKSVGFRALAVATSSPLSALSHADWATASLRREDLCPAAPDLCESLRIGTKP